MVSALNFIVPTVYFPGQFFKSQYAIQEKTKEKDLNKCIG